MNLFKFSLRPIIRCAKALERIAHCLEYFALADARDNGRIFLLTRPQSSASADKSDLLHTNRDFVEANRREDEEIVVQQGYAALEHYESRYDG
jgi:hypothetical protein